MLNLEHTQDDLFAETCFHSIIKKAERCLKAGKNGMQKFTMNEFQLLCLITAVLPMYSTSPNSKAWLFSQAPVWQQVWLFNALRADFTSRLGLIRKSYMVEAEL